LNTNGADYVVLRNFGANPQDGFGPNPQAGLVQGNDGSLYGATSAGGSNFYGTVFKMSTNGANYAVLHSFGQGPIDGTSCEGRLAQGRDGAWYGTAVGGGACNAGTVFRVNADGTGYAVLYNFATNGGAQLPYAGVVQGADGAWCGTAAGGSYGDGVVFRLAPVPPQFTSVAQLPDSSFQLSLSGASNFTYRVDASADLVNWVALTNLFNVSGAMQFVDRSAPRFAQRFYRAAWAP